MKEIILSSSTLASAPGLFEAFKHNYKLSDDQDKQKAVRVVASTWSVPSGAVIAAFEDDLQKVEVEVGASKVVLKLSLPLAEYCVEPYDVLLVFELFKKGFASLNDVDSSVRALRDKELTAAAA